jgi:hypothetical protein
MRMKNTTLSTVCRRLPLLRRRWREDERGTSMVTTAVTLPLFLVIFLGFFYMLMLLVLKWQLNQGTREAAQHLSEISRYWVISGTQSTDPFNPNEVFTGGMVAIPQDMYEIEARRIIASRLKDLRPYTEEMLDEMLIVTVTEPALAGGPDAPPPFVGDDYGSTDQPPGVVCGYPFRRQQETGSGEFLHHGNIRFLVQAQFASAWVVKMPFTTTLNNVILRDRATGYVQCPRWTGLLTLGEDGGDKAFWLAAEGPHLKFRLGIATPSWPTVTPAPTETPAPSATPIVR